MKRRKRIGKKAAATVVSMAMVVSGTSTAFAEEGTLASGEKYTQEQTADGWIKVTQDGGETLGYSPNSGVTLIEDDGYAFKDLNQNGELDVYEDWRQDDKTRAEDLASKMSTDEQLALMFQDVYDFSYTGDGNMGENIANAIDNGIRTFSSPFSYVTTKAAVSYQNQMQEHAEGQGYGIPINESSEASCDVVSQWPSNLGVAASFDPEVAEEYGKTVSAEFRAIGLGSMISPQMDLATEPRWGRISGTFGEDPQLSSDMTGAFVNGLQSTYGEDGSDLGWGEDSVNATVKHFPGDGMGEGGRESHNDWGKYAVYPGDQLDTQLIPFEAAFNLEGATGSAAAVMPSYSIALDEDGEPLGDEAVASAFDSYKLQDILRGDLEFDGVIISDYGIIDGAYGVSGRSWGMEDATSAEKRLAAIIAGVDMFGGDGLAGGVGTDGGEDSAITQIHEAYELGVEEYGEEYMKNRINESAVRILKMILQVGLFENGYVTTEEAEAFVNGDENAAKAYEAQQKSVVMLKNATGLVKAAEGEEKATVYIPYTENEDGTWSLPIDEKVAGNYFNVVTDSADGENVVRASDEEIAACDYALVLIDNPQNEGGMASGYDEENDEYYPISLQYRTYTADGENVREDSISGDATEVKIESPYGAQTVYEKENRSYYGNDSRITNESDLDTVLFAAEKNENVIVAVNADRPMIFSEFENEVDSILLHFGVSDSVICDIVSGQCEPTGLLPIQQPKDMDTVEAQYEDVPRDMECYVDSEGNTYDFAFGMNWSGVINDERVATYSVDPLEG